MRRNSIIHSKSQKFNFSASSRAWDSFLFSGVFGSHLRLLSRLYNNNNEMECEWAETNAEGEIWNAEMELVTQ